MEWLGGNPMIVLFEMTIVICGFWFISAEIARRVRR
jgi:hypothetical protein